MINYTEYYTNKVNNDINLDNKISKRITQSETKIKQPEPIKQVKNQALITLINNKINNEKLMIDHYKQFPNAHMSFAQPSENINFIASNVNDNVDKDISKEFDILMSKYVKEPYMLQVLKNKLDDDEDVDENNFMKEIVFQFPRYELDIKKWIGRHVKMDMFYEYLKNTLLETLNKKYPVSVEEKKRLLQLII